MLFLDGQKSRACTHARAAHILAALPVLMLLLPFLVAACQGSIGPGPTQNAFNAVAAISSRDVWAVGGMSTSQHFGSKILIEHWDGKSWHTAMPDMDGELCAISADSANDVWAVGTVATCNPVAQLLVMHWDGQHWQQLSTGISQSKGFLNGILALSSHDVWAVGGMSTSNHFGYEALIEHWDGSRWSLVAQPYNGLRSSLQVVAGRTANDLWTTGARTDENGQPGPLSEHWDGRSWHVVPMPGYMQDKRILGNPDFPGLAAIPGGQVWAAGSISLSSVYQSTPLIERWDGKQWRVVFGSAPQNPNLQTPGAELLAVIALDAQDAWAVGDSGTHDAGKTGYVLVYHWDGQSWQQFRAPSFMAGSQFSAISAITADDIWAVGSTSTRLGSSDSVTLAEHWDGKSWQAVASLNPGTPSPPMGQG